jgi:tRNA/rRNA methyltransferase
MIPEGTSVTLVEPQGPVNVGHVARLLRNFGVGKLYLVNPKVDISVAAVYASRASDLLDEAVVTTFDEVRKENDLLIATTAVRARKKSNVIRRVVRPERLHELVSAARTSSLVFGRDSTGLTNQEIRACDATTTIETSRQYKALNLGHAVAIVLYLVSRRGNGRGIEQSRVAREVFARSLLELGRASGVARHRTDNLFEVGKRIAASSSLTDAQLNLLAGVNNKAVARIYDLGSKT